MVLLDQMVLVVAARNKTFFVLVSCPNKNYMVTKTYQCLTNQTEITNLFLGEIWGDKKAPRC